MVIINIIKNGLCRLEVCLDLLISTGRLAEAAFFARTYLPSQIAR